jgi:dihydroneopterin aldolase
VDLEVFYNIGVTDEERAKPQRLLITVEMSHDISSAAVSDRIEKTINYHKVVDDLLQFGKARNWKLMEKLAANIADMVLTEYQPQAVLVEIKKFPFPQAKHVAVSLVKHRK